MQTSSTALERSQPSRSFELYVFFWLRFGLSQVEKKLSSRRSSFVAVVVLEIIKRKPASLQAAMIRYPVPAGASLYPGLECSGEIEALGGGVTKWKVGDEGCSNKRYFSTKLPPMATEAGTSQKFQLYPGKSPLISAFWREKYEQDARKYWDMFYKRNANRFFKDRHYLDKEWGQYFRGMGVDADPSVAERGSGCSDKNQAILEVGCGTGNTVYPLIAKYPQAYIYACDFSPRAVDLVKAHENYDESRVKAFVCDVTTDPLSETILQASVDVITLVFFLSAIAPEKMPAVVRNLKSVLKLGGYILLRDYAVGDLAQERFMIKDQQIAENFYVRGDGTRAYYFSEDGLRALFVEEGFECKEMKIHCRQLENRSRKIVMDRRWIQSVFYLPRESKQSTEGNIRAVPVPPASIELLQSCGDTIFAPNVVSSLHNNVVTSNDMNFQGPAETMIKDENVTVDCQLLIDLSATDLFGTPLPEPLEVAVGSYTVHAKCLPNENQHTYEATGFMLWESSSAFAELLAANSGVTEGKTVLELGCGSVGLCSLISSLAAKKVVATDGDVGTLSLLQDNLYLNKDNFALDSISCHKLEWGNQGDIEAVRAVSNSSGFQLIIGTDVTYVKEAVPLLFETARMLLSEPTEAGPQPLLVLCYKIRRVAESDIVSSARSHGFVVTGLWTSDAPQKSKNNNLELSKPVESLFKQGLHKVAANFNALQILCLSPMVIK